MQGYDPSLQKLAQYIYSCHINSELISFADWEGLLKNKDDAYAVQSLVLDMMNAGGFGQPIGWKVGCTSKMTQKMSGTDEPFFGKMHKQSSFNGSQMMSRRNFFAPIIEPEIAFLIGDDLIPENTPFKESDILDAIDCIMPAVEIVDCRFENGWPLAILPTIADNGVHGAFIRGNEIKEWKKVVRSKISVRVEANGEFISDGIGSNALGDPLNSVLWLANNCVKHGKHIKKGDIISPFVVVYKWTTILIPLDLIV